METTTTYFPNGRKEIVVSSSVAGLGGGKVVGKNPMIHRRIIMKAKRTDHPSRSNNNNNKGDTNRMKNKKTRRTGTPDPSFDHHRHHHTGGGGVSEQHQGSWYVNAWNNMRDQLLTTCHSPCGPVVAAAWIVSHYDHGKFGLWWLWGRLWYEFMNSAYFRRFQCYLEWQREKKREEEEAQTDTDRVRSDHLEWGTRNGLQIF